MREKAAKIAEFMTADLRRRALLGATEAALHAQGAQWREHISQVQPLLERGRCPDCAALFVSERYKSPVPMQRYTCPECKRFFLVHCEIAAVLLDVDVRFLPGPKEN
jgi:hypothetical protein